MDATMNKLAMMAELGSAIEGTEMDKAFKDTMDKILAEETDEEPVDKYRRASKAAGLAMIGKAPLIMRLNFLLNTIKDSDDSEVDWDNINKLLSEECGDEYDYNVDIPKVSTTSELLTFRKNLFAASNGLGFWKVCTCKECDKKFYMGIGEVRFYAEKNFALPKRCKACRTNKNNNSGSNYDKRRDLKNKVRTYGNNNKPAEKRKFNKEK